MRTDIKRIEKVLINSPFIKVHVKTASAKLFNTLRNRKDLSTTYDYEGFMYIAKTVQA